MKIKYFKLDELKCKCGECGSTGEEMNPQFMDKLDYLRGICGFPFVVTSAFRCPTHNNKVSLTGFSGPHTTGRAIDISVSHEKAYIFLENVMKSGLFTGIGINQKGGGRFIHLDDLTHEYPRPRVWSY